MEMVFIPHHLESMPNAFQRLSDTVSAGTGLLGDLRFEQVVFEAHDDHQFAPVGCFATAAVLLWPTAYPRLILVRGCV
jgi:hypothetical protein